MSAGFIGTIRLSPFPGRSRRRRHCCPSAIGTIRRSPHCRNSSDTSRSAGGAGEGPRVRRRRPGRVGGAPGRLAAGLCRRAARPRGGRHHRRRCARRPICAGTPRSGRQPCRLYRRRSGRERARPCLEDQLRCCGDSDVPLIHLSTDYVFDGAKPAPYREDDPVAPLGVYGASKEAGERAVRAALARHVILRTAWVYGVHGANFVKTILKHAMHEPVLRVVADQQGAPTAAADLAAALVVIAGHIARGAARWGTFHLTGAGAVSWHGFAEAIVDRAAPLLGRRPRIEPIASAEYRAAARRPANSLLDCGKIAELYGVRPRPWQEGLAAVLAELGERGFFGKGQ